MLPDDENKPKNLKSVDTNYLKDINIEE